MLGVALSLTAGTLGAALPALVLLWLVFALLSTGVTAEALEQTGGLAPTTFGGGYWLAVAVNSVTVLACVLRWFADRKGAWRPLAWLTLFYGGLIWLLLPFDWKGDFDAPDVLTTFAVLGADMLVTYVLPFVLLRVLLSGLAHAWQAANGDADAARRVIMVAGCLGLLGGSVSGALYAAGTEGYFRGLLPGDEDREPLTDLGVEQERQGYAEIAAAIGPPAPERYADAYLRAGDAFHRCAEQLASAESVGRRSPLQQQIRRLMRQGMSRSDAEDSVMDTLLRVCKKVQDRGVDDLLPYFSRAVCNDSKKHYRSSAARKSCSLTGGLLEERCACQDDNVYAAIARRQHLQALQAARSQLGPNDQVILKLRYDHDASYRDIAAELQISEATARQRVRRALARLRTSFERLL